MSLLKVFALRTTFQHGRYLVSKPHTRNVEGSVFLLFWYFDNTISLCLHEHCSMSFFARNENKNHTSTFSMREHFSLAFQDSCHFHLCYKCEIISLSCLPFLMHLQRQLRYLFLLLHQNYFTNTQNPHYCSVCCTSFPIANENFFFFTKFQILILI